MDHVKDANLNWRPSMNLSVNDACVDFYTCKRSCVRKWGRRSRLVLWVYSAVGRTGIKCGYIVGSSALSIEYDRTTIQRTTCAGAFRTLQSCPPNVLKVLLYPSPPLNLHIKQAVACSAVRLCEPRC